MPSSKAQTSSPRFARRREFPAGRTIVLLLLPESWPGDGPLVQREPGADADRSILEISRQSKYGPPGGRVSLTWRACRDAVKFLIWLALLFGKWERNCRRVRDRPCTDITWS